MQTQHPTPPNEKDDERDPRTRDQSIYKVETREESEVINYYLESGKYLIGMSRYHLVYDKILTVVSAAGGPLTALLLIFHSSSDLMIF